MPRASLFLCCVCPFLASDVSRADEVSFQRDVMAVLSKAGCNAGTCHGNQNGKNGFKLSLRGEDPAADLAALTRDTFGRRTNSLRPEQSLVLLKATAAVPHEGGRRFPVDSPEYRMLFHWIAARLPTDPSDTSALERVTVTPTQQVLIEPADHVQLRVIAAFADGKTRDVTALACFEPSNPSVSVSAAGEVRHIADGSGRVTETAIMVRYLNRQATVQFAFVPTRPGFAWHDVPEANYIDRHVFTKLRTLRMQPSELCADHVFLRRAYLDTIGTLPTVKETKAFLADIRLDKRARLIDQILERPEFADFWALKWSDLLRNEEKALDRKGVQVFHQWIRQSIAEGKPLNEFARELIAARGSTYDHPPANYYRSLRDPYTRAEATAQVFLGIRLQCAKCHNHPFDRWTQNDYHGLAATFSRIDYRVLENSRRDNLDKHEFIGEQIVWLSRTGDIKHPRTGELMSPGYLGRAMPEERDDRLQALADWIAEPANPYFARTQVNRVWFHLMGRGIVDPIDDFRVSNPPSNPALLDELAADFASHRFSLKHLVRTILNSRTYQLTAKPNDSNAADEVNFSHALPRRLQAEVLLDSVAQVLERPVKFNGYPLGVRAIQLPGAQVGRTRGERPTLADEFLKSFGKPERLLACECERGDQPNQTNALQLLSGELLNDLLTDPANRLGRMLTAGKLDTEILEEFYLAALCRLPSPAERRYAADYCAKAGERRKALEDLVWAVLNAKEFLLRG
jgi:hypothetical protein